MKRTRFALFAFAFAVFTLSAVLVLLGWARPSVLSVSGTPTVLSATYPTCGRITMNVRDPLYLIKGTVVTSPQLSEPIFLSRATRDRFEGDVCSKNLPIGFLNLKLSGVIRFRGLGAFMKTATLQLVITNMDINVSKPPELLVSDWMNDGNTVIFKNSLQSIGGMYPTEGTFEIDVSTSAAPEYPLDDYVDWNTRGTKLISKSEVNVSGLEGKEIIYIRTPSSDLVLKESLVYFVSGKTLYKCFMTFHEGDKNEQKYFREFDQTMKSIYVPN